MIRERKKGFVRVFPDKHVLSYFLLKTTAAPRPARTAKSGAGVDGSSGVTGVDGTSGTCSPGTSVGSSVGSSAGGTVGSTTSLFLDGESCSSKGDIPEIIISVINLKVLTG